MDGSSWKGMFNKRSSPRMFVAKLAAGFVMNAYGVYKRDQAERDYPERDRYRDISPADRGNPLRMMTHKLQADMSPNTTVSAVNSVARGFDVRRWEVPKVSSKYLDVVRYSRSTDAETRATDARKVVVETGKEQLKKIETLPAKAKRGVELLGHGVESGLARDDRELAQTVEAFATNKSAQVAQQIGLNMMMSAPVALLSGPIGLAASGFMLAKTIGNAGRELNDAGKKLGKDDGPAMRVIRQSLETQRNKTVAKATDLKPVDIGRAKQ